MAILQSNLRSNSVGMVSILMCLANESLAKYGRGKKGVQQDMAKQN